LQRDKRNKIPPSLKKYISDRSIILVSNRGPIQFDYGEDGEITTRRGGGGLVTAMTAISEETRATWISAAMTEAEYILAKEDLPLAFPEDNPLYHIKLVDIPEPVYDRYYNVISNPLIWFIHHYMWDLNKNPSITTEIRAAWQDGYLAANRLFAKVAAEESLKHSNPIIMLQDYHLFSAAKYIRELTDKPFIFHFTHIPWPEPDYMTILPFEMRTEILMGMLANDLLGFQSRHYADNFLLCCESLLGLPVNWKRRKVRVGDREAHIRTYPISIDHASLQRLSEREDVLKYEARLRKEYKDMKIIMRTDRSDPSKNIVRGFWALDTLLTKHPELKGKVKFLALLYPTRENIKAYKDYSREIRTTVKEINERHKTDGWVPIHLRMKDNYPESIAALKLYDVLLVNPIYDGMNLVAKEGPVVNKNNGVLLLSENAGASAELSTASLIINPFDIDGTADAMYQALMMPENEKHPRATSLREIVQRNNSVKWLYYQIKDIVSLERRRVFERV